MCLSPNSECCSGGYHICGRFVRAQATCSTTLEIYLRNIVLVDHTEWIFSPVNTHYIPMDTWQLPVRFSSFHSPRISYFPSVVAYDIVMCGHSRGREFCGPASAQDPPSKPDAPQTNASRWIPTREHPEYCLHTDQVAANVLMRGIEFKWPTLCKETHSSPTTLKSCNATHLAIYKSKKFPITWILDKENLYM